jgi:hypothetical protein
MTHPTPPPNPAAHDDLAGFPFPNPSPGAIAATMVRLFAGKPGRLAGTPERVFWLYRKADLLEQIAAVAGSAAQAAEAAAMALDARANARAIDTPEPAATAAVVAELSGGSDTEPVDLTAYEHGARDLARLVLAELAAIDTDANARLEEDYDRQAILERVLTALVDLSGRLTREAQR